MRSPSTAKLGPAGRGWGNESTGWGDGGEHPQSLSAAPDQPQGGAKQGSAQLPHRRGLWGSEFLLRDAPQKGFALAIIRISRLCFLVGKAEAVEGKCSNLARKNFL